MKYSVIVLFCMAAVSGCLKENYTPEGLGEKIALTYDMALHDAAVLLKGTPDPDSVRVQVFQLKTKYVKIMADYGVIRQKMNGDEKETVDSIVFSAVANCNIDDAETVRAAMEAFGAKGETDLTVAVSHFLIINQYANFDILMKYSPKEAASLGIPIN
ncbi:MAG: hypothetical protein A2Y33_15675 [Spirochaetes bacterium GWF1_51_8]|nr:MAG: hypothetical protein A2Y33_15675 [Spirochaetes bacterium GWF1_51_8]